MPTFPSYCRPPQPTMGAVLRAGLTSGPTFLATAILRAVRGGGRVGLTSAEVIPQLRIGPWPTAEDLRSVDVVVNLDGAADVPPANCFVWAIRDGALPDLTLLHAVGRLVAGLVRSGRSVLVHCREGFNRSGLVCGVALTYLGYTGVDAVRLIRDARGPWALSNSAFHTYLAHLPPAIGSSVPFAGAAQIAAVAMVNGCVTRVFVHVGQYVNTGDPVAAIAPCSVTP